MSAYKKSSKSLLKESLKIFVGDTDEPADNETRRNKRKKLQSSKKDLLLKSSSIKEIENVKQQLKRKQNLAQENLKKLKLLNLPLKDKTAKRILENIGHKSDSSSRSEKKKSEEKTVFTEEDFAKFEREYFAS